MDYVKKSLLNFMRLRGVKNQNRFFSHQTNQGLKSLPASFSLATWNSFKGLGGASFFVDLTEAIATFDLLCLQEVVLAEDKTWNQQLLQSSFVYGSMYKRSDGCYDGVMTICPVEVRRVKLIPSLATELFPRTKKVAIFSVYPIYDGRELGVLNVHAPLIRTPKSFAAELEYLIDQIKDHTGPLIVAGDFNTLSSVYLLELILKFQQIGVNYLQVARDPRPKMKRLDHFLVRDLHASEVEVEEGVKSSDHPLLSVRLSF